MKRPYLVPMLMLTIYSLIVLRMRLRYDLHGIPRILYRPTHVPVQTKPGHPSNSKSQSHISVNVSKVISHKPIGRKRIAFYTPYHGGLRTQMKRLNMAKCLYKNCDVYFTGATSRYINAHAVLFQGNHIHRVVPKRKNWDQVFVFISVEAPQYLHYTNLALPRWTDFFNWTMTYRLDSDIPYPYGSIAVHPNFTNTFNNTSYTNRINGLPMGEVNTALQNTPLTGRPGKMYRSIFRRKSKTAAWLVSHCITTSKREKYVNLMKPHMHIDIFGQCTKRTCKRGSNECRQSIINEYFFYLSFENSLCKDYITEKAFNWYNEDIIIVVRGARTYHNYLPYGTYIDADDFKSPMQLAKFLHELSKDEERYIAYLKRKDHFRTIQKGILSQKAYCDLCKRLNNLEKYRKSVRDIHAWWSKGPGVCTQPFDIYRTPSKTS